MFIIENAYIFAKMERQLKKRRSLLMKKLALLLAFAVVFSFAGVVSAQMTVTEAAVGTGIVDRQPVGVADTFSSDVTSLSYWTKIEGAVGTQVVKHVWRSNGNVIGEISLTIDKPSFRTWTNKTIYPALIGTDMSVEVVDSEGNVLRKDSFKIQ